MPNNTMSFIPPEDGLQAKLNQRGSMPASFHIYEAEHINAINAAIACRRPLLLTGDPGTGKSQLARAAAATLGAAFVPYVVDSRTESRNLLWHFDAVARLADAQLGKALQEETTQCRQQLVVKNYIHPGPLWWAFDWQTAKTQAELAAKRLFDNEGGLKEAPDEALEPEQWDDGNPEKGCVVLIDEIDKAELDVPNGLLEALGDGCFLPEGCKKRVCVDGIPPLVIITSNNERIMPDAFMRRCLVLNLTLPDKHDKLVEVLKIRGKAHFKDLSDDLLDAAAELVAKDRKAAKDVHHRPLPGQAEYIDLLRAVYEQAEDDDEQRMALLKTVQPYVVSKGISSAS